MQPTSLVEHVVEHLRHGNRTRARVRPTRSGEQPLAIVVACSDQREDVETVFALEPAELVVVQTPGPFVTGSVSAAVELAIATHDVQLVVVLAHEDCPLFDAAGPGSTAIPRCALERQAVQSVARAWTSGEPIPDAHARREASRLRTAWGGERPPPVIVPAILRRTRLVDFAAVERLS